MKPTVDDRDSRIADVQTRALSANVAGKDGIQHATWWKVALAIVVLAGGILGFYSLASPRHCTGPVEWQAMGRGWRLTLARTGTIVDFEPDATEVVMINGIDAHLPAEPSDTFTSAPAEVSWTPYLIKRNGVSGTVVAIDLHP
jgi:hypothetical protein